MMVISRSTPRSAAAAPSSWRSPSIPTQTEPDVRSRFATAAPLDLALTLSPLGTGPSLRLRGGEVWRASHTPSGPSTIHVWPADGAFEVEAWGPGARWAVDHAATLCGDRDDATGFQPREPVLVDGWRRRRGMRMPRSEAVFEALLPTVLAQKVPTDQANDSYKRIVFELGEPAPGPERLWVPPPAELIARLPYWRLHRFNVERRRADVLITAARSARRLEETAAMELPAAWARLQAFPGVGPWTAAKVATVALGDADAVPVGDYHLPHMVGYAFEGTARSSDERMLELLDPYRGHRARVIRLLILAGVQAPRFGPRMPLADITRS